VVKRSIIFASIIFIIPLYPIFSDLNPYVQLSFYNSLTNIDDSLQFIAFENTRIGIQNTKNKNVKSLIQLDSKIANDVTFDVPRAYIKVRFPYFRLTIGKTRTSWGEGVFFNAGDVIFGGMSIVTDMAAETLKDKTDWFIIPYIPIGQFSFLEFVAIPYINYISDNDNYSTNIDNGSFGGRLVTKPFGITLESGYLFNGYEDLHKPYMSLQGHLLLDWYISGSLSILNGSNFKNYFDNSSISFGLNHILSIPYDKILSLRLESGINPSGKWKENNLNNENISDYGIYLYNEVLYSPSEALSFQLRNIISPVDISVILLFGFDWNIYQGLNISGFISTMLGDNNDTFSLQKDGAISLSTRLLFKY